MDISVIEKNIPHNVSETEEFLFKLGMWWRIFYGIIRIIIGITLLGYIGTHFVDILYILMKPELIEDSKDTLYIVLSNFLSKSSLTVTGFMSVYLIFWGSVDILLSGFLLRGQLWAFPVSMSLMAGFIFYELYRLYHTHSFILLGLIVLDITIIWLIRREQVRRLSMLNKSHT